MGKMIKMHIVGDKALHLLNHCGGELTQKGIHSFFELNPDPDKELIISIAESFLQEGLVE